MRTSADTHQHTIQSLLCCTAFQVIGNNNDVPTMKAMGGEKAAGVSAVIVIGNHSFPADYMFRKLIIRD